ncbi:MAG: hypothetical protein D6761_00270 [Candidatus Dadabacteria bacterium]|nr:MAG: hypothetical protein D6761_00270 [Candidatus Dadabacteria bacterium]
MDTITIAWEITVPGQADERFAFRFDARTMQLVDPQPPDELPVWTQLEHQQCSNCPLKPADAPQCPPAANLVTVIEGFKRVYSYETCKVRVETENRVISAETTVESALASLIGLVMATSDCPHLTFFRPMARFHLPFADPEETLFRATGSYLLACYIARLRELDVGFNLEGLAAIYEEVQTVNRAFADRLRFAAEGDGTLNGLVALDLLAQTLPMSIEALLPDIDYLFEPFLEQVRAGTVKLP